MSSGLRSQLHLSASGLSFPRPLASDRSSNVICSRLQGVEQVVCASNKIKLRESSSLQQGSRTGLLQPVWRVHRAKLPQYRKVAPFRASSDPPPTSTSGAENSPEAIRQQLGELQAELEVTQRKASIARSRFMRLTEAAEQLRLSAESAVAAGNEAGARRLLEEKARVMEGLQRAQERADLLEALTFKLNQAISVKETELVEAISYVELASSAPNSPVLVVPPSPSGTSSAAEPLQDESRQEAEDSFFQQPSDSSAVGNREPTPGDQEPPEADPAVEERERVLQSSSNEELKERFLDLERAELERLWQWNEERDAAKKSPEEDKNLGAGLETATANPVQSSELENEVTAGISETESVSSPSDVDSDSSVQVGEAEDSTPGEGGDQPTAFPDPGQRAYLEAVEEEIAEVKAKIRLLQGTIPEESELEVLAAKLARGKGVLEGLYAMRSRLMGSIGITSTSDDQQEETIDEPPAVEDMRKVVLVSAVEFLRQGDNMGAAGCLQKWLVLSSADEAPHFTLEALMESSPESQLSPMDQMTLYLAYVRHSVVATILAALPSSWNAVKSESRSPSTETLQTNLDRLQALLGLQEEDVYVEHERILRTTATDMALSRVGPSSAVTELASVLAVDESTTASIEVEAAASAKLKRLVNAVLRELKGSGSTQVGWRDARWALQDRHCEEIRWAVESLELERSVALAATAAACREVLRDLLEPALASLAPGASSSKLCSLQLENLISFVKAAALPAMLVASEYDDGSSEDFSLSSGSDTEYSDEESGLSDKEVDRPPQAEDLIGLLRLSGLRGGESESLYLAFCDERTKAICRKVTESVVQGYGNAGLGSVDGDVEALKEGILEESWADASILSTILGLPPGVETAVRKRAAKQAFAVAARQVVDDGKLTEKEWVELDLQQRVLGLDDSEAAAIREEAGGQRVTAMCRKLLDRRNSGGDITAADIRTLTAACTNLGAAQVTGIEARDRMALFRRAVQIALDPTNPSFKLPPARTVQEGTQMLAVLQRVFSLPEAEVNSAIAAVTTASASAALLQARASLRRKEIEMAADDVGRLAVVLGMHPQALPLPQELPQRVGSAEEAKELFELYSGPSAEWIRRGSDELTTSLHERELEEEILNRMRTYLRV